MPVPKFDQYEPTLGNVQQQVQAMEQQVERQIDRLEHHTHGSDGIVVYGADWCPWTTKQKDTLSEAGIAYTFKDCQKEECPGISGFPTIEVAGQQLPGFKDADAVRALMGQ
jgi:glutaredoxin